MNSTKVFKGLLDGDESEALKRFSEQSKDFKTESKTESKSEMPIEKTIEPLTFMISPEKIEKCFQEWAIFSQDSDAGRIGYRVKVSFNALASSCSFAIKEIELKVFQEALETNSLEKIQTALYKLAIKRLTSLLTDSYRASEYPDRLKYIAICANKLQEHADSIGRAADIKLTQAPKSYTPTLGPKA